MNALAHGADSLYTPFANPVSEMTALSGAGLIAAALDQSPGERDRAALAFGSVLCGYAIDSAGFSLHHVVCQTLVRVCGSPTPRPTRDPSPRPGLHVRPRPRAFGALADALDTTPEAPPELGGRTLGGGPRPQASASCAPDSPSPAFDDAVEGILRARSWPRYS